MVYILLIKQVDIDSEIDAFFAFGENFRIGEEIRDIRISKQKSILIFFLLDWFKYISETVRSMNSESPSVSISWFLSVSLFFCFSLSISLSHLCLSLSLFQFPKNKMKQLVVLPSIVGIGVTETKEAFV